ncbi:MAG: nitrate/nitrite transporter NrtS [Ilumatobacteraceae bacterium]
MSVRAPVPPWSSPVEACRLILRGVTFATGVRVALVVGTILSVVNQGSVIVAGDATAASWVRVGVNYLVPFLVSSIGYLAPFRVRPSDQLSG